jgi:hypothetical protein
MNYQISHYIIFTDPFEEYLDSTVIERQVAFSTRSRQSLLLIKMICDFLQNGHHHQENIPSNFTVLLFHVSVVSGNCPAF